MFLTTKNGYGFFEAVSALQKGIRRADEPVAMFFTVELFNSGYDEYLWKRIKVIASEDIGLAEPYLVIAISALYQAYSEVKKENKSNRPERLYLTHAILMLLKAKKSRYVDLATIKHWREHDLIEKLKIPDYAFDKHTVKGKKLGRGIDHFHTEGTLCKNFHPVPGEPELQKEVIKLIKAQPGKLTFAANKKGNMTQHEMNFETEDI